MYFSFVEVFLSMEVCGKICNQFARPDSSQAFNGISHEARKAAVSWPTVNLQQQMSKLAP